MKLFSVGAVAGLAFSGMLVGAVACSSSSTPANFGGDDASGNASSSGASSSGSGDDSGGSSSGSGSGGGSSSGTTSSSGGSSSSGVNPGDGGGCTLASTIIGMRGATCKTCLDSMCTTQVSGCNTSSDCTACATNIATCVASSCQSACVGDSGAGDAALSADAGPECTKLAGCCAAIGLVFSNCSSTAAAGNEAACMAVISTANGTVPGACP